MRPTVELLALRTRQDAPEAAPREGPDASPGQDPAAPDPGAETVAGAGTTVQTPDGGSPPGPYSPGRGLVAVGLLIALVMVLGLIVLAVRKRLFRDDAEDRTGAGLLDELREALREGRMTQEEFDAAKRVMVAKMRGTATPEKNGRAGRAGGSPS